MKCVIGPAARLVKRAALAFAPVGAPSRKTGRGADRGREIGLEHGNDLGFGRTLSRRQGLLPVRLILVGQKIKDLCQQVVLRLEMKQHQPVADARTTGDVSDGGPRKPAFGQTLDRRFDHLTAPGTAIKRAGRKRFGIGIFG